MVKSIQRTLYANKASITIFDDQLSVGMLCPEGVGVSSMRPEEVKSKKAKLSMAAKILDMIFIKNTIEAYKSKEDATSPIWSVVFTFDKKEYKAQFKESGDGTLDIYWTNQVVPELCNLIPPFIYAATISDEINGQIRRIEALLEDKQIDRSTNQDLLDAVARICDAFYYGYVNNGLGSINVTNAGVEEYVIDQGINKGFVERIDLLSKSVNETQSINDIKEITYENYTVNYEWDEMQSLKIPRGENYVMTSSAEKVIKKIKYRTDKIIQRMNKGMTGVDAIGNDYVNILLVGRPASGKTKLAYAAAEALHVPVYTIPFTKNTEEDTVEGKNKVVNGKIDFVETDFLKAYQNGGIIVLEEINLADPAVVMGSLGQAIEYPFIVMKDGYEPIRRHPLCIIIGTMNTGTVGSKQLNEALSTRFKQTYILNDPNREVFLNILKSKGFPAKHCRWVYDAYQRILKSLRAPSSGTEELAENITLRSCIGALENIEEGSSPKDAIIDTMIGKVAERDLEVANKLEREVVSTLAERI